MLRGSGGEEEEEEEEEEEDDEDEEDEEEEEEEEVMGEEEGKGGVFWKTPAVAPMSFSLRHSSAAATSMPPPDNKGIFLRVCVDAKGERLAIDSLFAMAMSVVMSCVAILVIRSLDSW